MHGYPFFCIGERMKNPLIVKIAKSLLRIIIALAIILGIPALCYLFWQPEKDGILQFPVTKASSEWLPAKTPECNTRQQSVFRPSEMWRQVPSSGSRWRTKEQKQSFQASP